MATNTLKDLHAKIEHMVVMRDENCYEVCNENGWSFREKSRTVEFRDAMCEWRASGMRKRSRSGRISKDIALATSTSERPRRREVC